MSVPIRLPPIQRAILSWPSRSTAYVPDLDLEAVAAGYVCKRLTAILNAAEVVIALTRAP